MKKAFLLFFILANGGIAPSAYAEKPHKKTVKVPAGYRLMNTWGMTALQ